ncbi:MAG TPA: MFS transporter [Stellaceae bacterium]|nr:MFS transporter [Stellaceae bacterium]
MTADTSHAGVRPKQPSMRRLIVAATIGNIFEWFDFVVYGFFAVTLAEVFFPAGNLTVSLLVTFGAFGLAYFVRPLGAIVVGGYTDRAGRKAGLLLSMALMMIGTTLMAVTPGYATIGLAAPIIITLARLLQGFSVGGEFGSAVSFLAEHGGGRRGFSASWQFATGGLITVLASLFGLSLTSLLTHEQLVDWGWRIPYVFGMLIGPAGLYVRSKVVETPEFLEAEKPARFRSRTCYAGIRWRCCSRSVSRSSRTAPFTSWPTSRPTASRRCTCRRRPGSQRP